MSDFSEYLGYEEVQWLWSDRRVFYEEAINPPVLPHYQALAPDFFAWLDG